MLDDYVNKVFKICLAVEDLAFAVNYVFLQVESNVLRYAEVLHRIRNRESHLFAYPEKMIDCGLGCEDYCREISEIYLLLPEILRRNPFNLDKLFEVYLQVVFFCELEIW